MRLPRKKKKILKANCKFNGVRLVKMIRMIHKPCERIMIEVETKPI